MANVGVLVGNAPTSTSSRSERSNAERFGYLVDRGTHVEWHRDGYAERWALPGRPSGGLPVLSTVHVGVTGPPVSEERRGVRFTSTAKAPTGDKLAQRARVHVPGFTLDGTGVLVGSPVDAPQERRGLRRLRTVGYALAAIAILALAIVAFFAGGDSGGGMGGGKTEVRMWLLDAEGEVMAVSGGCSTSLRSQFFPEPMLDRLRAMGIRIG